MCLGSDLQPVLRPLLQTGYRRRQFSRQNARRVLIVNLSPRRAPDFVSFDGVVFQISVVSRGRVPRQADFRAFDGGDTHVRYDAGNGGFRGYDDVGVFRRPGYHVGHAVFGEDLESVRRYGAEVGYFHFGVVEGFLRKQMNIEIKIKGVKTKEFTIRRKTTERETKEKNTETK